MNKEQKFTEKQSANLAAVSELFAENGFVGAPTNEVEGTIFKHYNSKKELLN